MENETKKLARGRAARLANSIAIEMKSIAKDIESGFHLPNVNPLAHSRQRIGQQRKRLDYLEAALKELDSGALGVDPYLRAIGYANEDLELPAASNRE